MRSATDVFFVCPGLANGVLRSITSCNDVTWSSRHRALVPVFRPLLLQYPLLWFPIEFADTGAVMSAYVDGPFGGPRDLMQRSVRKIADTRSSIRRGGGLCGGGL